ncbi:hypothetical protein CDD83_8170 [Cordyceps sp. RAO-2017]|nr:hypothetical protein CDD83_8170 [Cordyceps sp. RAO-2017]
MADAIDDALTISNQSSPRASYADIVRTPPSSQPSNLRTPTARTTPSSIGDSFYCTIDTSRAEEQSGGGAPVGKIRRASERDAGEVESRDLERQTGTAEVKEAARKTVGRGARIMRDQLYPVKVDNVNRTAVLDGEGNVLPGAVEALGAENNVTIATMSWLSKRETGKAYGSMVVYVTKGSDARRLLDGQYFDLAGESACTNVFEPRKGPVQCQKFVRRWRVRHAACRCEFALLGGQVCTCRVTGYISAAAPALRIRQNMYPLPTFA